MTSPRRGIRYSRAFGVRGTPAPIAYLRQVVADAADIRRMFDELIADELLDVRRTILKLGKSIDHVVGEMETVDLVAHRHIEWRRRRTLLFISAHVEVCMIRPPIGEPVDERRITMVGEYDRHALREQR